LRFSNCAHRRALLAASLAALTFAGCSWLYTQSPRYGRNARPSDIIHVPAKPARPSHPMELRRGRLPWPVQGTIAVPFGSLVDPKYKTTTKSPGIEIATRAGSAVTAVDSGSVSFADQFMGYGKMVIVDHGGRYHSIYSRLREVSTSVGTRVMRGQQVGVAGDTLHFEFRVGGRSVDPLEWLAPQR
jgi:septal ring factor EnvC (AmiA/AmiB activator)